MGYHYNSVGHFGYNILYAFRSISMYHNLKPYLYTHVYITMYNNQLSPCATIIETFYNDNDPYIYICIYIYIYICINAVYNDQLLPCASMQNPHKAHASPCHCIRVVRCTARAPNTRSIARCRRSGLWKGDAFYRQLGTWLELPVGGLEQFFIFPYIGNNHTNWLIFFRGVETTNQIRMNRWILHS